MVNNILLCNLLFLWFYSFSIQTPYVKDLTKWRKAQFTIRTDVTRMSNEQSRRLTEFTRKKQAKCVVSSDSFVTSRVSYEQNPKISEIITSRNVWPWMTLCSISFIIVVIIFAVKTVNPVNVSSVVLEFNRISQNNLTFDVNLALVARATHKYYPFINWTGRKRKPQLYFSFNGGKWASLEHNRKV